MRNTACWLAWVLCPALAGCANVHRAARKGDLTTVKWALFWGADVNGHDEQGRTPLHRAALGSHPAVVRLLIERGADDNAASDRGTTALHYAMGRRGSAALVESLLAGGANVNAKRADGTTALHRAAARAPAEIVELLLSSGAEANARDNDGRTPLHHLVQAEVRGRLERFFAYNDPQGPALWRRRTEGRGTTLWTFREIVRLLLAKGADVNARDKAGRTPLSFAGKDQPLRTILVRSGAKE